jgi:hypothetical protein
MMNKNIHPCVAAASFLIAGFAISPQSSGQTPPTDAQDKPAPVAAQPAGDWSFTFTPYGWMTFYTGTQTVKGRTVTVDTNVFQLLDKSESLVPWMSYFEARFEDRIGLFLDVMYANIKGGKSAAKDFTIDPFISGSLAGTASVDYETLTVQFGGAYQFAKIGPDRSAEGPGMAGVGQTAFDALLGGRYWYQRADLTINLNGTLNVAYYDLELSRDRTKAIARSGVVTWVDPYVGFRVRHKLAPRQDVSLEADIGGFGLGSRISWQALGAYRFEFATTGNIGWAGVVGYRALYVDYAQGSGNTRFEMDLLQHGPVLGISARF